MNKLTVTIGIPAYNEEANIQALLRSVLAQESGNFELLEILVYCDGCTDQTAALARAVASPRIRVYEQPERKGQIYRQNQMLKVFRGDVLVLLEADTLPQDRFAISRLLEPFCRQGASRIGMTVGRAIALPPRNFLQRILYTGYAIKSAVFSEWKQGSNIFGSNGQNMRALSREFARTIVWPADVPEDAYLYLRSRQSAFSMKQVPGAVTQFRTVGSFADGLKQTQKFLSGKRALREHFDPIFLRKEYGIPRWLIWKHVARSFIRHPLLTIFYLFEVVFRRAVVPSKAKFSSLYEPYTSTKDLSSGSKIL